MKRSHRQHSSGRWPKLKVTTDGQPHRGPRLLAGRLGIADDLSAALAPIVKSPRHHAPGQVLVDLTAMLADGDESVSDLRVLRDKPTIPGRCFPAVG